jgi:ribose transport system substrate-binding protein
MSRTLHPTDWDPQNNIVPIDPQAHWGADPTDKGKLNQAYAEAGWKSEYDEVTKLYADHYKTGPFL